MEVATFGSMAVALLSAGLAVTRLNAFQAVLYLITTLLALAVAFFALGAPFAAALQVIVYAGAIVVLFVFVIMMLNLGRETAARERSWAPPRVWAGPAVLSALLLAELLFAIRSEAVFSAVAIEPGAVGARLFGPYLLAVELASLLLLAGLVAAYHIGQHELAGGRR